MKITVGDLILLAPTFDQYGKINKVPSLPCLVEKVDEETGGDGIDLTVLILENGDRMTIKSNMRYFRQVGHFDGTYTPNFRGYDHPDYLNCPTQQGSV